MQIPPCHLLTKWLMLMNISCTNISAFLRIMKTPDTLLPTGCTIIDRLARQVHTDHMLLLVFMHIFLQQCYRHVFTTLLESLSQHGHNVFMVIQKLLNKFTEPRVHILILNLQSEVQQQH